MTGPGDRESSSDASSNRTESGDREEQSSSSNRSAPRSGDRETPSESQAAGVAGPGDDEWPVELRGVTESVVATLGPNDRWNFAALGLRAPAADGEDGRVTARTWGNTRTRRNFRREGGGVVQFVADPRAFVDAALTVSEGDDPVLDAADAWVRVGAERIDAGESGGTDWAEWALSPAAGTGTVRRSAPRTIDRGFCAVVEATVAASRLDVPAYDADELLDRLAYFADVVERCGGPREREAFARVDAVSGWRDRRDADRDGE